MHYSFSDIEINIERFEVIKNGAAVQIEPLIFDLLCHFVRNPDRLFSRDELIDVVWAGRLVSDSTVSSAIKTARKCIGDSGDRQLYIKTIHGRGFRFVAEVKQHNDEAVEEFSETVSARESQNPSLIILPIKSHGDSIQLAQFTETLVLDMETILSRLPLLKISGQASRYNNVEIMPGAQQIYEDTGVHYIIQGIIQEQADQLRLTIQLTDARTDIRLWSEQFVFNTNEDKLYADKIVIKIIAKLEPQLYRAIQDSVRRIDGQPCAEELYLQASGLLALKGWHENTFLEAVELLRKSEKLDPELAVTPAYLALILAFGHRVGLLTHREQAKAEAIKAVERALQLDSMDSTVLGFTGCALADIGMFTRAKSLLKNALTLNSSNAQAWVALGSLYLIQHDLNKSIEYLNHGIQISPLDSRLSVWGAVLAVAYMLSGDLDKSQEQAELACERDDKTYMPRVVLAAVHLHKGELDVARDCLQEAYRIKPDLSSTEIAGIVGKQMCQQLLQKVS